MNELGSSEIYSAYVTTLYDLDPPHSPQIVNADELGWRREDLVAVPIGFDNQ